MIAAVAAVDNAFAIGRDGGMLISIPEDLKMFRLLTSGHVVIMGRKTFDALPGGPLKHRINVVITSRAKDGYALKAYTSGSTYYEVSMQLVKDWLTNEAPQHRLHHFIIGGGVIYRELLPWCERLYLTHIHHAFPCADTYFPKVDLQMWQLTERGEIQHDKAVPYNFCVYDRRLGK